MEIALPAIKTKTRRKKRKPMPPYLVYLICVFFNDCFWFAYDLVKIMLDKGDRGWNMALAGMWVCLISLIWPQLKREWKAWRKDNEDE